MQVPFLVTSLGLLLATTSAASSAVTHRVPRNPVRHVRADRTIVPAPMQVDTSAHPRVDMPPGMQGVPTNTNLSSDFAKKRR